MALDRAGTVTRRYRRRSAMAGALWGALAFALGRDKFRELIWFGVAASPFIGIRVGALNVRFRHASVPGRMLAATASLYGGAARFGLAIGLVDAMTVWFTRGILPVLGSALGVLWGITFAGYLVFLWPLALVTQTWVWAAASDERALHGSATD